MLFNQIKLPFTLPFFQLLFAANRTFHILVQFIPNQQGYLITVGKSCHLMISMLVNALNQIGGYADIQRAIALNWP